jgi:hypothetical protein
MGAFLSIDEFAYHDAHSTLWGWPGQNPIHYRDLTGHEGAPQWLLDFDDAGYFLDAQNFVAGVTGSVTFGISDSLFAGLGVDNDKCSSAYAGGEAAGIALGFLEGGSSLGKLAKARGGYGAVVRAIPQAARDLVPLMGEESAARWAVAARDLAKAESRDALGIVGNAFDALNEARYGNALGPTANELYGAKGSWDAVISSAGRTGGAWDWIAAAFQ